MMTMLKQSQKRIGWLQLFFILTGLAIINLMIRSVVLTPPIEFESVNFWPIILYDQLSLPSILFLPVCLLVITGFYLVRKQFGRMLLTILAIFLVAFFGTVSLIFDDSFTILDSLKYQGNTYFLGVVSDIEGWGYIAFCVEKEGQTTCDYFYTVLQWEKQPTLLLDKSTENLLVKYETQTLYTYSGRLPGTCSVSIDVPSLSGNCGAYFEATRNR